MTSTEESFLKTRFLERNPRARNGIFAAIQRNRLYANNLARQRKCEIWDYWQAELNELGQKYENPQSVMTYLADVFQLRHLMNDRFAQNHDIDFRLSHAQKSLAVFLKYKWCVDEIPAPPLCPIDRNVLQELGVRNYCWTKMKEENLLRTANHLAVRAEMENLSIAQWELKTFENL